MGRADPFSQGATSAAPAATPWRHLPNLITMLRVLLVVPAVSAVADGRYDVGLALVFLAGLSDGLDGYLAKRFKWQSRLGAVLDPLADKLLFVSLFVVFAVQQLLPPWLVAVVIARDAVIVSGALGYRVLIGPFTGAASGLSKLNTLLLLSLGLTVLIAASFDIDYRDAGHSRVALALVVLGSAAFCTTVLSGVHYVASWSVRARRVLDERRRAVVREAR